MLFAISNTKFYVSRSIFSMSTSRFPYSIQFFRARPFQIRTVHAAEEHYNIYIEGSKTIANKLKTSGMVATKLLRHILKNRKKKFQRFFTNPRWPPKSEHFQICSNLIAIRYKKLQKFTEVHWYHFFSDQTSNK